MKINEMDDEASWASSRRCNNVGMKMSGRDETPPRHRKFPEPCGWEAPSIRSTDDDDDDDDDDDEVYSTCTGSTARLIRLTRLKNSAKHKPARSDLEAEWAELEQLLLEEWDAAQAAFQRQGQLLDMYFAFRERYDLEAEHLVDAELHQDIVEWDDERWMVLGFREARAMARVARGRRRPCDQHSSPRAPSNFTGGSTSDLENVTVDLFD